MGKFPFNAYMSNKHTKRLLSKIDACLKQTGMSKTYFGKRAVNDGKLYSRLENGGRCWPETEARILKFIAKCKCSKTPGKAKP